MNGLEIVQTVYRGLRKPSDLALPYRTILDATSEVITQKKLDLALASTNALAQPSKWFTPSSADFDLDAKLSGIFLPVRVERRGIGSEWETGAEVPIVSYDVLNNTPGAVSFYGAPLRMVFSNTSESVSEQEYRIIYEPDFNTSTELGKNIQLPDFFAGMIAVEVKFKVIDLVEDESPEWRRFVDTQNKKLFMQIERWDSQWEKYCQRFLSRQRVPKRTFLDRGRRSNRLIIRTDGI